MFIRRHYYDLNTGDTVWSYMVEGNIMRRSTLDELNTIPELNHRTQDDTGVFEWLEPNEEIESKFNGNYSVSIDVSTTPHALVFTEIPEPEPIPEDEQPASPEDYETALEELGVINNDN